jgi:hypothetical protein
MDKKENSIRRSDHGEDQKSAFPPKQHTDHSYSTSHGFDDKADKLVYEKT